MIDEGPRGKVKLDPYAAACVGFRRQIWTSDGGTIDRIMNACIVENRSNDPVLDVIEADLNTADRRQFGTPGPF